MTALAACAGLPQAGSAIVWEGGRITDNQVAVTADQLAAEVGMELSPNLTQFTVNRLAQNVLVDEAAERAGVSVTAGQVEAFKAQLVAEVGGEAALAEVLAQSGVPRAELDAQAESSLLYQELTKKLDPEADPQQGSPKVAQYLVETSLDIELETNPRFGVWDPQQLSVVPDPNQLSRLPDNGQTGALPEGMILPQQ
jgi:hypothetical protein